MVHEIPWVKSSKPAPLAARLLSNQEEFRNLALELVPGAGLVGHKKGHSWYYYMGITWYKVVPPPVINWL